MEDEKGLDLSLALPCGGSSSSIKGKYGSSSDIRSDEGDRGSKLINEFKNFLEGGNQQHPLKAEDNFYNNFGKTAVDLETSKNSNTGEIWVTNDSRTAEVEEEKRPVCEKRKSLFTEMSHQKKHEGETNHTDLNDKTRASHISINTDDGSTAENEDVADSEVDGSTSRQVSPHDDASKHVVASSSLSRTQKDHAFGDHSGIEHLSQKRFAISSEKDYNMTNLPMPYDVSFPSQPVSMSYSQPVKDSNPSGKSSLSSYPMPGMMHTVAATNSERPGIQPVMPANFPLMFGYTPVQLPALDKDNSRGIVSHHQHIHSVYSGRSPINSDMHNDSRKVTQGSKSWGVLRYLQLL